MALVAFVVARKLCGPSGGRELERLKQIAGADDGPKQGALTLLLRDWAPWFVAAVAAAVGFGFVFVKSVLGSPLKPFENADLPKLTAGFLQGCERSCAAQGSDGKACERFCACTLSALRVQHPSDEELVSWFSNARRDLEATQAELRVAQNSCLPGGAVPQAQLAQTSRQAAPSYTPPAIDEGPPATVPPMKPMELERVKTFVEWATAVRNAPRDVAGSEVCAAAPDPSAGICTRSVVQRGSDDIFSVSYAQDAGKAVRASATFNAQLDCSAVAPSQVLRRWSHGVRDPQRKQTCTITGGALSGMQLLVVRTASSTTLFLYSSDYVARDTGFRNSTTESG
jgi:hypothetical protein